MKSASGVRIPELAIGSAIVLACVAGALLWSSSAEGAGTRVVVAAHDLERGHVISASDLADVEITTDSEIALLSSTLSDQLVGLRVTTDVAAGAPLTEGQLGRRAPLDASDGLVGVVVALDEAPAELAAGDRVDVVAVSHEADGSIVRERLPMTVDVWDVAPADEMTGERSITLRVSLASAADIVGFDEIHLVKVGG